MGTLTAGQVVIVHFPFSEAFPFTPRSHILFAGVFGQTNRLNGWAIVFSPAQFRNSA